MKEKSMLSVEVEHTDKAPVIVVSGRIDGSTEGMLESVVQEQINAGHKNLIFDFKGLNYISSIGLRSLLIAARHSQREGGKAVFCNLADHIAKIFENSGFKEIVNVHPTRADALEAL